MLYKNGLKLLGNQLWLYITWRNEQKILLQHFGICQGQCTTDGREYALSLCPIKGAGFWKKIFNKSDGDFQQLLCQNQFQRDVYCARNIRMTFQYFDIFLYETFSFIFGLGFDFGSDYSDSCVIYISQIGKCQHVKISS